MSSDYDAVTAWLDETRDRVTREELVPKVWRRVGTDTLSITLEAPGEHIVIQVYRSAKGPEATDGG